MEKSIEEIVQDMQPLTDYISFFRFFDSEGKSQFAEDIIGFGEIFIREFEQSGVHDKLFFANLLKTKFEKLIERVTAEYSQSNPRDIEIGNNFLNWLKELNYENVPTSKKHIQFPQHIIDKAYAYNNIIFQNLSREQLELALNSPEAYPNTLKPKAQNKYKLYSLIFHLRQSQNDEWLTKMFNYNNDLDQSIYIKKGQQALMSMINF